MPPAPPLARAAIYSRQSKDKTKSLDEQATECETDAVEQGWTVDRRYSDGVSASRFAKQAREHWPKLLADLEAGHIDVLILWESSRGDRDAESWLGLLRRCRDRGVRIRVTSHERTYNLAVPADWKTLATEGIDSSYESEKTSLRLRRAVAAQAKQGRPHGPVIFGYQRVYGVDDKGKRYLVEQRPHPDQAPIVVEIFHRVARGDSITAIVNDLNERGVPAPRGGQWGRNTPRSIALNIEYTGKRELRGEVYAAVWPPLVEESLYLAAKRRLTDPARKSTRPGRQRWLLSYLGKCWCGAWLHGIPERAGKRLKSRYECERSGSGHCSIVAGTLPTGGDDETPIDGLDPFVIAVVVQRLAQLDGPDLRHTDDAAVLAAREEVARLQARLDEWRESARRGETSPASLAAIEAGLLEDIRQARRRAVAAAVPPALVELVDGVDVVADVESRGKVIAARLAGMPVSVRREVISLLVDVTVHRAAVRGRNQFDPTRVEIVPK